MASYKIISDNQSYDINTLSSGSVTLPYYGGYKDKSNNVTGNISKSTPHDISVHYISGSGWLTSSISMKDDTASSITLNYTSATGERSARIYLKGAGLTSSNYITVTQNKPSTVSFYWRPNYIPPYNMFIWAAWEIHSELNDIGGTFDRAIVSTELSEFFQPTTIATYLFNFYLNTGDGKYYCEHGTIKLLQHLAVETSNMTFREITGLIVQDKRSTAVVLENFFNTINNYYTIYFDTDNTFLTTTIRPYGKFNVTADDVLSGKYTSDFPYVPGT